MPRIEFTQEVNAANAELRTRQDKFQSSLNEIDGLLNTGGVKPAHLLVALQAAAHCENAIQDLRRAFEAEEKNTPE